MIQSSALNDLQSSFGRLCIGLLLIFLFSLTTTKLAAAQGNSDTSQSKLSGKGGWIVTDLLSACKKDCAVTMLTGQSVTQTPMTDIFLHGESPANWQWDNSFILALAFSRPWVEYRGIFSIEPETGIAKRFGPADGAEGWVALFFRWKYFPWNQYIRTSLALGIGPSLSNDVFLASGSLQTGNGIHVINYFSPELTLGSPSEPRWDAVVRFHHRSPIWGVLPESAGVSQFWTFGMRFRF